MPQLSQPCSARNNQAPAHSIKILHTPNSDPRQTALRMPPVSITLPNMATRAAKVGPKGAFDLLPPLPPEGPALDALIKLMVAEADADPRPPVPTKEVFVGLRKRHAERLARDT